MKYTYDYIRDNFKVGDFVHIRYQENTLYWGICGTISKISEEEIKLSKPYHICFGMRFDCSDTAIRLNNIVKMF